MAKLNGPKLMLPSSPCLALLTSRNFTPLRSCVKQIRKLMLGHFLLLKQKSGRGPPTAPTLRPRVLTPRDHFAHRGGERRRIMQQSD